MRRYLGALITIAALAGIGILVISILGAFSAQPTRVYAGAQGNAKTLATSNQAALTLQVFPSDPYQDPDWIAAHVTGKTNNGIPFPGPGKYPEWVRYWPSTDLVVPAHSTVTVTIENYDSPTPLLNPFYSKPQGVVGGSIMVDGKPTTEVDPNNVSHTFTIHGIPNANPSWLYVSVPVTGADPNGKTDAGGFVLQPAVTVFTFTTGDAGTYIWQCFDPCGSNYNGFGGPMQTRGMMSGTFTVK